MLSVALMLLAASTIEIIVVTVSAFLTSVLSAVAGLGGGTILLAVLAQFFAPATAIPVQGAIQIVSNGSRARILRRNIEWPAVLWSLVLLFPASFAGAAFAGSVDENVGRVVIATFALVVAWRPQLLKWRGDRLPVRAMVGVGAVSGLLTTAIGVSGPVTSPFFRAVTKTHVAFVASAAAAQTFSQGSKIVAYVMNGWEAGDVVAVIIGGIVAVVAGSWVGAQLLGRIDESHLAVTFKVVLTALAVRLLVTALW